MENLSKQEQEKLNLQMQKVFNTAEKPLMRYIVAFLDETPETLFVDEMPEIEEPLILLPMEDYKKNICIKFTLDNVDSNHKLDIKDLLKYELVNNAIGFLYYCIKSAYSAIVSSMINSKPLENTTLQLCEDSWTFKPIYTHELNKKKLFLEETLSKLMDLRQTNKDTELLIKINKECRKAVDALRSIKSKITPEVLELEERINLEYQSKPRLGIFIEELHKNKLPKPIYQTPKGPTLPTISDSSAYSGKNTLSISEELNEHF